MIVGMHKISHFIWVMKLSYLITLSNVVIVQYIVLFTYNYIFGICPKFNIDLFQPLSLATFCPLACLSDGFMTWWWFELPADRQGS